MSRASRGASNLTRRGRNRVLAIDAGASAVRVWTPGEDIIEVGTATSERRRAYDRADATGAILAATRDVIRPELPRALRRHRHGFRVAVAVPARASVTGRRRAQAAAQAVNRGGPVVLMEAPLAAAIGANVDIAGTTPRIVLDVGVHGSEAAVLFDGRVVDVVSCYVGCHDVERAVVAHVYRRHHVVAAPHAAWRALRGGALTTFVGGGGNRTEIRVNETELAADLSVPIAPIVGSVRRVVQRAGSRLGTDILAGGIVVVGGGGFLPALLDTLRAEFGARTVSALDPRRAIIRGLAEFVGEAGRHPRLWSP